MGRKRGIRRKCGLGGCEEFHYAIGLCKKHYYVNYYNLNPRKKKSDEPFTENQTGVKSLSPQEG